MGYYSTVRVMTDLENFEKMQNIFWELAEKNNISIPSSYPLFPKPGQDPEKVFDHYDAQEYYLCFGFDNVKWHYHLFDEVNLFMEMLDVANEYDIPWQFLRIGEDYSDIENMESDNFYAKDMPYMTVSVQIEY